MDEAAQAPSAASPYATGEGGTRLESRLGTVVLVRLLAAQPVFELDERAPERVMFQQAPDATVDDLICPSRAADDATAPLDIAVRRAPSLVRSHTKAGDLVGALVKAALDAERSVEPLVERRLAVAVSGQQQQAQQVAELAVVACGQSNASEFVELVRTQGKFRTRARFSHLIEMVADALRGKQDDAGTPEDRCRRLPRRLWIMHADLETGHEDDWTRLVGDPQPVVRDHTQEQARALRDRLEQLSGELARNAGALDDLALRRRLHWCPVLYPSDSVRFA